jgi:hypothetical protein
LEVGAEGGFKLDLRQDCDPGRQDPDPGKQKLKGAVRTETYQRHYCQHLCPLPQSCVLKKNVLLFTNKHLLLIFEKLTTYRAGDMAQEVE